MQPGPGVGGHCIAVDPWFIVAADRENSRLIQAARGVNDSKPNWVINQVETALEGLPTTAKVALLGLAFKPNIDDLRESPALEIAEKLIGSHPDTDFFVCEPNIAALPESLLEFKNCALVAPKEAVSRADVTVLLVGHDSFKDLDQEVSDGLSRGAQIIDTTGLWREAVQRPLELG